jgi:hypothetical protein
MSCGRRPPSPIFRSGTDSSTISAPRRFIFISFFKHSRATHHKGFFPLLFSVSYELPILQPLCFEIHACNGGCIPPNSAWNPPARSPAHYPLCIHLLAHSFALIKNSSLFFSSDSALFHKNTRGGVPPDSFRGSKCTGRRLTTVPSAALVAAFIVNQPAARARLARDSPLILTVSW